MTEQEDIREACKLMRQGGIILYPTDTVWGIGCDATNSEAVDRIYKLKQRDDSKSMIVLVESEAMIQQYVCDVPDIAWELVEAAVKPLTVVYDRGKNLAPNLLAEDGSIGIRMTAEALSANLCRSYGRAIVSTSANVSGRPTPQRFADIEREIVEGVDYVFRSRRSETAPASPSSIIRLGAGGTVKIIRP